MPAVTHLCHFVIVIEKGTGVLLIEVSLFTCEEDVTHLVDQTKIAQNCSSEDTSKYTLHL